MTVENLPSIQTEAAKAGSAIYFTGKPCKRGHVSPRHTISGDCTECAKHRTIDRRKRLRDMLGSAAASSDQQ